MQHSFVLTFHAEFVSLEWGAWHTPGVEGWHLRAQFSRLPKGVQQSAFKLCPRLPGTPMCPPLTYKKSQGKTRGGPCSRSPSHPSLTLLQLPRAKTPSLQ